MWQDFICLKICTHLKNTTQLNNIDIRTKNSLIPPFPLSGIKELLWKCYYIILCRIMIHYKVLNLKYKQAKQMLFLIAIIF